MTWGWAVAALTLIPFAVWMDWLSRPLWFAMLWGGFMLAQYLSLLPHEFGHALMARAVGYRPLAIVCGGVPPLIDVRVLGVRTLIGPAPEDGMAAYDPTDDRWPRLKHALIVAAGPLANLLLAALAYAGLMWIEGSATDSVVGFILLVFGLANAWLGLGNLWPSPINTAAGQTQSDGALLLSLWKGPFPEFKARRSSARMVQAFFAYRDEKYEQAIGYLDEAEALTGPAHWLELTRSAALCNLDRPQEARERLRLAMKWPEMQADPASLAVAENNLAWASFMIDSPAEEADRQELSKRALEVVPWLPPVLITRVCILATAAIPGGEQLDEARRLLSRVDEFEPPSISPIAKPLARGLLAAAQGDFDAARRWLQELRSLEDPGMVARVLEARIPSG